MKSHRNVVFTIVAILLLLTVSVPGVSAGWIQCRSDPVVLLSNGLVMDLSADISTLPWQVQRVDYVLHVPEGVSLVLAIHTPTWLTSTETFTLYDDAPPGEYHSETTVYTSKGNATVTAKTILLSALGVQLDFASVPGVEGQIIHTYLHVP
jgi:hypothetical protein